MIGYVRSGDSHIVCFVFRHLMYCEILVTNKPFAVKCKGFLTSGQDGRESPPVCHQGYVSWLSR